MRKLRTGDKVVITKGKNKGMEGEVIKLITKEGKLSRVVVKGVNVIKRSVKPNPQFGIAGGIEEFEAPLSVSNVMLLADKGATKVGIEINKKDNKKYRVSKKTGKKIE